MEEGKGVHWMNWENVRKPVHLGGSELGNLRTRNKVLLANWLWCFP